MNKLLNQKKLSGLGPIGIFAASMIILFIITPSFRSMANFTQILLSASVYMLLAMGMSFAIIIDGIDLSAGSIVGLTGGIACMAMTYLNLPVPVALILGVLVGAVCGLMGLLLTAGTDHTLTTTIVGGRGFTAVMVSWMAKFNPIIMIFTSLLLVVLGRGASEISSTFGLNQSFSDILTGIILFFIIGSEFFITYQVSLRKSGKKEA